MIEDNEISDDDGFSFGSDITVEPEDQESHRQIPKRIRWGPELELTETDERSKNNDQNSRIPSSIKDTPTSNPTTHKINDTCMNPESGNQRIDTRRENQTFQETSLDINLPPLHQEQNQVLTRESIWAKLFKIFVQLLPPFCITCVLQFVDLINVHLYLIGLIIFQSIFWPSIGFIVYSIKFGSGSNENGNSFKIFSPFFPCSNGRWINSVLLELHGLIVMGATLLQLLAIQYLDITEALTLSFLSVIILTLLQHIINEKKCSVELVATSILGYTGVILITIPSVLAPHPYMQSLIYNGVAASIASTLLTIQSSFILIYLRNQNTDDSLLLTNIGFNGTIFCLIAGGIVKVLGPVQNCGGFIAAIVLFTLLANCFLLVKNLQGKILLQRQNNENGDQDEGSQNGEMKFISILKLKIIVFLFCCFWGIFKQFYRQSLPSVYSVLGVTLLLLSFLFTIGFKEWYAFTKSQKLMERRRRRENDMTEDNFKQEEPDLRRTTRFEFIPWLFTREPILFFSR